MSIFKSLFGAKSEQSPRDIVYEFANVVGQLNSPILDTVLLRNPKETIRAAFHSYIPRLKAEAAHSQKARAELQQVEALYVHIADFQEIDLEDKAIVSEINAGRRFEKFRAARTPADFGEASRLDPEASKIWGAIEGKYFQRSSKENGIG